MLPDLNVEKKIPCHKYLLITEFYSASTYINFLCIYFKNDIIFNVSLVCVGQSNIFILMML